MWLDRSSEYEIQGERPRALLLEERVQAVKELYAAITWDYSNRCPVLIASSRGGMEIESVAKEHPKDIARIRIDTFEGYSDYHGRSLAVKIGLVDGEVTQYARMMSALWEIFVRHDAELAEINPLGVLQDGTADCTRCKVEYRRQESSEAEGFLGQNWPMCRLLPLKV